jgi:hypothetical protein
MQDARRHVDKVARIYQDSVEQAEHPIDVLARHQRLEVVAAYVFLQA